MKYKLFKSLVIAVVFFTILGSFFLLKDTVKKVAAVVPCPDGICPSNTPVPECGKIGKSCCASGQACENGAYCAPNDNCYAIGQPSPTPGGGGGGGGGGGNPTPTTKPLPAKNKKCTCVGALNACGTYFGYKNIKYRECTQSATGTSMCALINSKYIDYRLCSAGPTATPKPSGPVPTAPVGTLDLCKSVALSKNSIAQGKSINVTSTAKNNNIVTFEYRFFNRENMAGGKPKPIMFTANKPFVIRKNITVAAAKNVLALNFTQFNKKDLNTKLNLKPKLVRVEVFFKNATGKWSKADVACAKNFQVQTTDPTPTINPDCKCNANGTCATACTFDKYPNGVTYANPIKCNLGDNIFQTAPTAFQKNAWCRAFKKTKGDADADGDVTLMDYFYFVGVKAGDKLPPTVNPDFDGNGVISDEDRDVIIKTLKL